MRTTDFTKLHGKYFTNEGNYCVCRICDQAASISGVSGHTLQRQSVRKYHTVSRCAKGLRSNCDKVKQKATENAKGLVMIILFFYGCFAAECAPLSNVDFPPTNHAYPRARSRSHVLARGGKIENAAGDDLCGRRVAKHFDDKIYFGTIVEKIKGAVLAKTSGRNKNVGSSLECRI
jgi:hypothetical protein